MQKMWGRGGEGNTTSVAGAWIDSSTCPKRFGRQPATGREKSEGSRMTTVAASQKSKRHARRSGGEGERAAQ